MKKKWPLLICLGIAVLILVIIAVFYVTPYVKLNDWVVFVNKRDIANVQQDCEWVSGEDFIKLRVVETVNENEFVHLKTKKKIKIESFTEMTIKCDITAHITLKGTNQVINEFQAKKEIYFQYKNNRWIVTNVKDNTIDGSIS